MIKSRAVTAASAVFLSAALAANAGHSGNYQKQMLETC